MPTCELECTAEKKVKFIYSEKATKYMNFKDEIPAHKSKR